MIESHNSKLPVTFRPGVRLSDQDPRTLNGADDLPNDLLDPFDDGMLSHLCCDKGGSSRDMLREGATREGVVSNDMALAGDHRPADDYSLWVAFHTLPAHAGGTGPAQNARYS